MNGQSDRLGLNRFTAAPAICAAIVMVLSVMGVVIEGGDGRQICYWVFATGAMVVTNCLWPMGMPVRAHERVGVAAMIPWVMNVMVGCTLPVLTVLVATDNRFEWPKIPLIVMGVSFVGSVVGGYLLGGNSGWRLLGIVAWLGGVDAVVGVFLMFAAISKSGAQSFGYVVCGLFLIVVGAVIGVPTGIGSMVVRSRAGVVRDPVQCARCGYDLRGTMKAGRLNCPECGLKI